MTSIEDSNANINFASKIASVSYGKYHSLPKTGKPNNEVEWTLLSTVVKVQGSDIGAGRIDIYNSSFEVVALGTGSKCIGSTEMSPAGDVLNDSHAEIFARRGFLRYLYHETESFHRTGWSDIFKGVVNGRCTFKDGISFHFFTSQTPCGDGSIFSKVNSNTEDFGDCLLADKKILQQNVKGACDVSIGAPKVNLNTRIEDVDCVHNASEGSSFKSDAAGNNNTTCIQLLGSAINDKDSNYSKHTNIMMRTDVKELLDISETGMKVGEGTIECCESIFKSGRKRKLKAELKSEESDSDSGGINFDSVTSETNLPNPFKLVKSSAPSSEYLSKLDVDNSLFVTEEYCEQPEITVHACDHENLQERAGNDKHTLDTETRRTGSDIYRTGAKCLPTEPQDLLLSGADYHVVGVLRTKPGRGDPTLSLSCSDKLARWTVVGCQGALLSVLVEPVRFGSLTVGGGNPFSLEALYRAIVKRMNGFQDDAHAPLIMLTSIAFSDGRPDDGSKQPCASSIVWSSVPKRPLEVAVKGRKQGVTKKVARTSAGRLQICKRELARQFVEVLSCVPDVSLVVERVRGMDSLEVTQHLSGMSYTSLKALAVEYQAKWLWVKNGCFRSWPEKPSSLVEFTLDG